MYLPGHSLVLEFAFRDSKSFSIVFLYLTTLAYLDATTTHTHTHTPILKKGSEHLLFHRCRVTERSSFYLWVNSRFESWHEQIKTKLDFHVQGLNPVPSTHRNLTLPRSYTSYSSFFWSWWLVTRDLRYQPLVAVCGVVWRVRIGVNFTFNIAFFQ